MEEDDVPPLEDMSAYIEQAQVLNQARHLAEHQHLKSVGSTPSPADSRTTPSGREESPVTNGAGKENKHTKEKPSSFGGFKSGFLFSGQKEKPSVTPDPKTDRSKSRDEDIPFVKPNNTSKSSLEFPEVQEAMKSAFPLLATQEWVTEDLLDKIQKHPLLSKAIGDPRLARVLADFQSNPQAALAAAQGSPELQAFLQEFCGLMGEHFTSMADEQEKEKVKEKEDDGRKESSSSSLIAKPSEAEEQQMKDILSRPGVREALADPVIQTLIETLRTDPEKAQRMLRSLSTVHQQKVTTLVENGLLAIQKL